MAQQALFIRHFHAAQDELAALHQTVDVVTMTNAHFLSSVLGPGQVLPGGYLDVCVVALYQLHRTARQLEQAAVVGDEAGAGLVQFIQRRQIGCAVEALGRLHRI